MSRTRIRPFRMTTKSPEHNSTNKELWVYIVQCHSQMLRGNSVLAGYEFDIRKLEFEKYPPMDKIDEIPKVADEDLPFLPTDTY